MLAIQSGLARPFYMILTLSSAALPGCGTDDALTPAAESFDRSATVFSGPGGVAIIPAAIKGRYGPSCKLNPGMSWSLKLNDPAAQSIRVALNDTLANCPLTITALQVQAGAQMQDFPVVPAITLGLTYATEPSAVNQTSPAGLAFYTNARLSGLASETYANNFTINLLYSGDAQACGAVAPPAIYARATAVATGTSTPAPNYSITFDTLQLVVDSSLVVQDSSSGNILLKHPALQGQVGEEWATFGDSTPCCQPVSFAYIDNLYKTGHQVATGAITSLGDIGIHWTQFGLLGLRLPSSHTMIVKHTDGSGVYSYELFQILFPGPPA